MCKRIWILFLLLITMGVVAQAAEFDLAFHNGAIKNCFTAGISPSLRLTRDFYLELEFFIYPDSYDELQSYYQYYLPGNTSAGWNRSKNSAYNINLAALYELKIKNLKAFTPYMTVGIGFLHQSHSLETISYKDIGGYERHINKSSKSGLNVGAGGGFKYRLTDRAGLRFDCRWVSAFSIYQEDSGSSYIPDFDSFGVRFTGGFYIKL